MNLKNIVSQDKIILSIDPSSHSLGWAIIESTNNSNFGLKTTAYNKCKLIDCGKIKFTKNSDIAIKFNEINDGIKTICKKHHPSVCVIEQSVYIQNFQTSRIISYIIGYTWGVVQNYCFKVLDINPIIWKRNIGYENLSKQDKLIFDTEIKRKKERKDRVRNIIVKYFKVPKNNLEDDDIVDAIGIGLWYHLIGFENGPRTL